MFEFINDEDRRGQVGIGTLIVFIAMVLVAAIAAGVLINTAGFLQTQAEETGQDSTDQVANNINVIGTVGSVNADPKVDEIRLTAQKSAGSGDIDLSGLSIQYVGPSSFSNLVHHSDFQGESTESSAPTSQTGYLIDAVTAETPGDNVMTDAGDRYEIIVPLNYEPTSDTTRSISTQTDGDDVADTLVYDGEYSEELKRTLPIVTADGSTNNPNEVSQGDEFVEVSNINWNNNDLSLLEESANVEITITTESGSQRYVNLNVPDSLVNDNGGTVQL